MLLGVNIDHIATLRQVRGTFYPNLNNAAELAVTAGADSITVHLREDRRHIQDSDVQNLKKILSVPLNLELAVTNEMLDIAEKIQPGFCCFVPERREELTTEGGLDVCGNTAKIKDACARMDNAGIRASIFIDADSNQIQCASECGAQVIEIHTGRYADADTEIIAEKELLKITDAVSQAVSLGMKVNAGHGLNYDNVQAIVGIDDIMELNIGHAIVAQSVFDGLEVAIRKIKHIMSVCRSK